MISYFMYDTHLLTQCTGGEFTISVHVKGILLQLDYASIAGHALIVSTELAGVIFAEAKTRCGSAQDLQLAVDAGEVKVSVSASGIKFYYFPSVFEAKLESVDVSQTVSRQTATSLKPTLRIHCATITHCNDDREYELISYIYIYINIQSCMAGEYG
jgi:hypothetical protein